MRFGSVCSGIEAASVAWHPLGWRAEWLAEIEPFPSAVLAHHYPDTPNLGDMTTIAKRVLLGEVAAPEVLTGGTPCQAFSVAGLRQSLADERGNLTLKFVELLDAIDHVRGMRGLEPAIAIWENVPGVLSTKDNAFGCFLAGLAGEDEPLQPPGEKWANAGCVYGPERAIAWRTLDAQYFGLAQRRRRVFVVASAREGFDPAAVLFEWDSVRRDSAPSREAGEGAAVCPTLRAGGNSTGGDRPPGTDVDTADSLQVVPQTAQFLTTGTGQRYDPETETIVTHTLRGEGFDASEDGTGRGTPLVPVAFPANLSGTQHASTENLAPSLGAANPTAVAVREVAQTITSNYGKQCDNSDTALGPNVALSFNMHKSGNGASSLGIVEDRVDCLRAFDKSPFAVQPAATMQVRRLTPRECERLQGFPDDYTLIPWRKKPAEECPDGPRYKALGNSWAVPCARWIGERVEKVLIASRRAAA